MIVFKALLAPILYQTLAIRKLTSFLNPSNSLKFLLLVSALFVIINSCGQTAPAVQNSPPPLFKQHVTSLIIPSNLSFAGENVPLDSIEVFERMERELIVNVYKHASTLMILKRAPRYKEKIIKILREEGVPEDFFYLAAIESEFDPYANSGFASGFWQITPDVALENNLEVTEFVEQRYDIVASTHAVCKILKKAKEKLGSWTMAAAAFNRGMKGIDSIQKQQQVNSYYSLYLNTETARYVFRILAMKIIMEHPENYGYYLKEEEKYKPFITKTIRVDKSIEDLTAFARAQRINYKLLKYYNPWLNFNPTYEEPADKLLDKAKRRRYYRKVYRFEVQQGKVYYFEIPVNLN